jgi:hypothetical protein
LSIAGAAVEPNVVAEQHGREVNDDFIEQTGLQTLSAEGRPEDPDILVSSSSLRGGHRPLDSIRDEGDPGARALLGRSVGEASERVLERNAD